MLDMGRDDGDHVPEPGHQNPVIHHHKLTANVVNDLPRPPCSLCQRRAHTAVIATAEQHRNGGQEAHQIRSDLRSKTENQQGQIHYCLLKMEQEKVRLQVTEQKKTKNLQYRERLRSSDITSWSPSFLCGTAPGVPCVDSTHNHRTLVN